jgi:hypothetical protein
VLERLAQPFRKAELAQTLAVVDASGKAWPNVERRYKRTPFSGSAPTPHNDPGGCPLIFLLCVCCCCCSDKEIYGTGGLGELAKKLRLSTHNHSCGSGRGSAAIVTDPNADFANSLTCSRRPPRWRADPDTPPLTPVDRGQSACAQFSPLPSEARDILCGDDSAQWTQDHDLLVVLASSNGRFHLSFSFRSQGLAGF